MRDTTREFALKKENGHYVDGFGCPVSPINAIDHCHTIKDVDRLLRPEEIDASNRIIKEADEYVTLQRTDYIWGYGYGQAFYDAAYRMQQRAREVTPDIGSVDFVIAAAYRKAKLIQRYGKEA